MAPDGHAVVLGRCPVRSVSPLIENAFDFDLAAADSLIENLIASDELPADLVSANDLHAVGPGCQVRSVSPPRIADTLDMDVAPVDSLIDNLTVSGSLPADLVATNDLHVVGLGYPVSQPTIAETLDIDVAPVDGPIENPVASDALPADLVAANDLHAVGPGCQVRPVSPPMAADTLDIDLAPVDNLIENLFASDALPADLVAANDLHEVGLGCQVRSDSFISDGFSDGADDVPSEAEVSPCRRSAPIKELTETLDTAQLMTELTVTLDTPGDAPGLWFELTETFDHPADDDLNSGYEFDLQALDQIAQQFSKDERLPEVLRKELTEDLGSCEQNWDDSEFGFSDEQLETLWKRFGSHMGGSASGEHCGSQFSTPAPKTLETVEEESSLPCTDALNILEEAIADSLESPLKRGEGGGQEDVVQSALGDFIGETLEQFIGAPVPALPSAGMLAWMVSAHNFDGEDWYLFKVSALATNRFYMKTFADFEELHAQLASVSKERGLSYSLPQLSARDYFGMKRFFGGADFSTRRTNELRTYVSKLMSHSLTPWQEQVVRLFFGPSARGRILPPKGQIHRGLAYGSQFPAAF